MRTVVVHEVEGFTERGMSLSFGWDATPSSPLGLTAQVAPVRRFLELGVSKTAIAKNTGVSSKPPRFRACPTHAPTRAPYSALVLPGRVPDGEASEARRRTGTPT